MRSCRFAESNVRWASRLLWMAVVSQASVKSSRRNRAWKWWRQKRPGSTKLTSDFYFGSTKVWLCYCLSMWVHSNPLMSYAGVTFTSPPVVTPPPIAKSVSFTGNITLLRVRRLEMCLDPYKNWIQVDPIFEFLKLLLCCDVALSSPIARAPVWEQTHSLNMYWSTCTCMYMCVHIHTLKRDEKRFFCNSLPVCVYMYIHW